MLTLVILINCILLLNAEELCGLSQDEIVTLKEVLKAFRQNKQTQNVIANQAEEIYKNYGKSKEEDLMSLSRVPRQVKTSELNIQEWSLEKRVGILETHIQQMKFDVENLKGDSSDIYSALEEYDSMLRHYVDEKLKNFQSSVVNAVMSSTSSIQSQVKLITKQLETNKKTIKQLQKECNAGSSCLSSDIVNIIESRLNSSKAHFNKRLQVIRNAFKTEMTSMKNYQKSVIYNRLNFISDNFTQQVQLLSEADVEILNMVNKLQSELEVLNSNVMSHVFSALNGYDEDHRIALQTMNNSITYLEREIFANSQAVSLLFTQFSAINVTLHSIKAHMISSYEYTNQQEEIGELVDVREQLAEIQYQFQELKSRMARQLQSNMVEVKKRLSYKNLSGLLKEYSNQVKTFKTELQQLTAQLKLLQHNYNKTEKLEDLETAESKQITTSSTSSHFQCRAIGSLQPIPGSDGWCADNCAKGFCPTNLCDCSEARKAQLVCRPIGNFKLTRNAEQWCSSNCPMGNCPPRQCICETPQPKSKDSGCYATNAFKIIPNADKWCEQNCALGHCPPSSCLCI